MGCQLISKQKRCHLTVNCYLPGTLKLDWLQLATSMSFVFEIIYYCKTTNT